MDWINEGGTPVLGLLCCALVSHPLAIAAVAVALVSRVKRWALVAGGISLAVGLGAIGLGVAGYLYGISQVEAALAEVPPEVRAELLDVGRSEAMISIWVGLVSAAFPLLAGVGALARGMMLPVPRPPEAG